MNLTGQVAPRTPFAIIGCDNKVKVCADHYTFCNVRNHWLAFQKSLSRDMERYPGATPIIGPIAELLYMAIKGYRMHGSPHDANPQVALAARQTILNGCQLGHADALLAQKALVQWGPTIKPWWHTTKLDNDGRILWDAPEYDLEIPLPELPPGWHTDTFYTTLYLDKLEVVTDDEHLEQRRHPTHLAIAAPNHAAKRSGR